MSGPYDFARERRDAMNAPGADYDDRPSASDLAFEAEMDRRYPPSADPWAVPRDPDEPDDAPF